MKIAVKSCVLLLLSLLLIKYALAGAQGIAIPSAYAHNDYWHKRPLYDALNNGFTYIEADIYLRKNKLIVAHTNPLFKKKRTLEKLYLEPLAKHFEARCGKVQNEMDTLVLMIDIKSDGERTFVVLDSILQKYKYLLSTCENGQTIKRNITVVLTGHKPMQALRSKQCRLFYVDENLQQVNNDIAFTDMYVTASCKYSSLVKWNGKGNFPPKEKNKLCKIVAKAHRFGKKVRLWASPEKEKVWQELLNCGVDLINTNKLVAFRKFFTAKPITVTNTTQSLNTEAVTSY